MPYICKEERFLFDSDIHSIASKLTNPGQLTYIICKLLWGVWDTHRSFKDWCKLRAAVEEAVSDFRERHISVQSPEGYEYGKLLENGDIYD